MKKKIAVLAGDGIGPEVVGSAVKVLKAIEKKYQHQFELVEALVGGAAYQATENHLPEETLEVCKSSDAVLFGSVGGPIEEQQSPKWKDCEANSLLGIRKTFNFSVNYRPARVYSELSNICPLKPELLADGVDLLIIRELVGDLYFGEHKFYDHNGKRAALDTAVYDEEQIKVAVENAFEAAKLRKQKVTSVDKANVLHTSKLWREIVEEVAPKFPEVKWEHMLVDNAAMQIIKNPAQFDVIVSSNMFGDILSDAAAVLPGSLGLTPSASFNADGFAMYEPSGGSAPDIAGQNIANPTAQILSAAMMLKYSFKLEAEAFEIENTVSKLIQQGKRTKDIAEADEDYLSTSEWTDELINNFD